MGKGIKDYKDIEMKYLPDMVEDITKLNSKDEEMAEGAIE